MILSIITINRNNYKGLRRTIDSVVGQTFHDYEWIAVDGDSTDGSRELLELHADRFAWWTSEPDSGIYNAINKALAHATGEYVLFLNSGDWLHDSETLARVFDFICKWDLNHNGEEADEPQPMVFYGDMIHANADGTLVPHCYPEKLSLRFFLYYNICHQATFYRRSLFDGNLYDESFRIVSDWAMNLKLMFGGVRFEHMPLTVAYYDNTGLSSGVSTPEHHADRQAAYRKYVPYHIREDVRLYEQDYHFSRHRRSTRWIMDHTIRFCQWLDRILSKKEARRNR